MYNLYWLLIPIVGLLQPILSEHIVIDGSQCCLHSFCAPLKDENVFLDRKYHGDDANSNLNIEREIRQSDRRYERRDGHLGREDTRLSVERHVERQIFAPTDHSRSRSRTTEAHVRKLHRTFRDVRSEPQIRTYLQSHEVRSKHFRLQDRSTEPRQVLDRTLNERNEIKNLHTSYEAVRINRSIRRSVLNEDIVQKTDTGRHIGRTQYRISEARRNDDEIFRNTVRYSRDNSERRNSVSQQRVRQIEDGQEHVTSRLDRSHKLFKRGTSQMSERTPDRNTNLRSEHINTRRIEMDISRQRSVVLNRGLRQSEERHSRMGETKNLRFDSTDTRINKRDNSKFGAIDERDRSEQSLRRVMGGFTSRNHEDQIRNLRSERMNIRNRERFVRENSPANHIPTQRELARQSFLREVDNNLVTDRNEYKMLNVHRDYRNNERLTRDTARTVFSHPELRYNKRSASAVCQMREIRNTCARVQKTDGTRAERYDDERKVARSVDRTVLSDRFTDQLVTRSFRTLSIRGNDISVKQNLRPSGVRMLAIESTSRNRQQRNALMRGREETRRSGRNKIGNPIFRTWGGYIIREEYRYNRNHERNYRHADRHPSLEPSVRQTDIRNTNRPRTQNREERGTNRGEERKDVLNNKRGRSLSVNSVVTQLKTRNNDRRKIQYRENDNHRNTNRYIRDESVTPILVRREVTKTGLRNVEDDKVIQNREARETNTYQERTHTNMENRILREITHERNSHRKDERRTIGEEHQKRSNNPGTAMIRHTTRAREGRHTNRDEERRQFRTPIQRREMNEEFTRLKTELTTRRTNVKNVRDVDNGQRSASDTSMYREFRKVDMERYQSRRNIEIAYIIGTIIPTKSYGTDSKSIENSYISSFYWQYLFYAIQGFYILYVFKQMLREKDTSKKTNFMGWTSQRVIKVD